MKRSERANKAIEKIAKLMEISNKEVVEEAVLLFEGLILTSITGGYRIRRSRLEIVLKNGKLSIEEVMCSHILTTTLISAALKKYEDNLKITLKSMKELFKARKNL